MSQNRTFEFTDRALKGLPIPPKPKQLDYFDAKTRGLGLRVSYGGQKTFFGMYTNAAGKRQRVSLGKYGRLEAGKLSILPQCRPQRRRRRHVAPFKELPGSRKSYVDSTAKGTAIARRSRAGDHGLSTQS